MNRHILCTVGTSLLTNPDRPWEGWKNGQPLPDKESMIKWLCTADLVKASAETNTLNHVQLHKSDSLDLLHSATPEGNLCAELLQSLYNGTLRSVSVQEIQELGYGAEKFSLGLKGLVSLSVKSLEKARKEGREPLICATGGFKAEIAFLNLLGALLGVEVIYLHERHRSLVRLPRLPLRWDDDFVLQHEDFFKWIDEEPRPRSEADSWLKSRPELQALVENSDDGCTYLSPAGDLLYKAAQQRSSTEPRAAWPEADPRPPEEKNQFSGKEHHRPKGSKDVVDKLCRVDCVSSVRHDGNAGGRPGVRILDAQNGAIAVVLGETGKVLPLRVETTARGQAQCDIVAKHIQTLVR